MTDPRQLHQALEEACALSSSVSRRKESFWGYFACNCASLLLLSWALYFWFRWIHGVWPPDRSVSVSGDGPYLLYLWCRGIPALILLAGPSAAAILGCLIAVGGASSESKALRVSGISLFWTNCAFAVYLCALFFIHLHTGYIFR